MRKQDFCLCENKGTDQLRCNCEADQHLCFRYNLFFLLNPKFQASTVQVALSRTWLEIPTTGFLASPLICLVQHHTKPVYLSHSAYSALIMHFRDTLNRL